LVPSALIQAGVGLISSFDFQSSILVLRPSQYRTPKLDLLQISKDRSIKNQYIIITITLTVKVKFMKELMKTGRTSTTLNKFSFAIFRSAHDVHRGPPGTFGYRCEKFANTIKLSTLPQPWCPPNSTALLSANVKRLFLSVGCLPKYERMKSLC